VLVSQFITGSGVSTPLPSIRPTTSALTLCLPVRLPPPLLLLPSELELTVPALRPGWQSSSARNG